jgi:hypothetical protein
MFYCDIGVGRPCWVKRLHLGIPTALPWAASGLPLAGLEILQMIARVEVKSPERPKLGPGASPARGDRSSKFAVVAGCPAAVHHEDVPGEVGVSGGCEEKRGVGDFLRGTGAAQWDVIDK